MKKLHKLTALITVLLLVTALLLGGCSKDEAPQNTVPVTSDTAETDFGAGATAFTLEVTNLEGTTKSFTVHTDETVVGKALLSNGLIDGEDGPYGLYVKSVMGIPLDYDTDGKYWAFYVDGEYGMTGVDQTEITAGSVYAFRAE